MAYNSRKVYAEVMKIYLKNLKKFSPHLDESSKKIFLHLAKDTEIK